jgi:hypothetical protein
MGKHVRKEGREGERKREKIKLKYFLLFETNKRK